VSDTNGTWSFDDLELQVGDDVLVANDKSLSDMAYAKVIEVKKGTQAIDAIALGQGGRIFRQCWHRDDPRIKTHTNRFINQGSGIFVLTEGDRIRKGLAKRMAILEQRIATLDAALARRSIAVNAEAEPIVANALATSRDGEAIQANQEPEQSRRGPGRPRKSLTE